MHCCNVWSHYKMFSERNNIQGSWEAAVLVCKAQSWSGVCSGDFVFWWISRGNICTTGDEWDHRTNLLCDGLWSETGQKSLWQLWCCCSARVDYKMENSLEWYRMLLKDWKEHAEADCFFCFTNLMSDIRLLHSTASLSYRAIFQGLFHQNPRRLREWDSGHNGQTGRQVPEEFFAFLENFANLNPTASGWERSIRSLLIFWTNRCRAFTDNFAARLTFKFTFTFISISIFTNNSFAAGDQNAIFCFPLAFPPSLTGFQKHPSVVLLWLQWIELFRSFLCLMCSASGTLSWRTRPGGMHSIVCFVEFPDLPKNKTISH